MLEIIPNKYDLLFNWTFSEGVGRIGNWSSDYNHVDDKGVVEFKRLFIAPTAHWARLKLNYITK